jgi:hypothetical protein
LEFVIEDEPEDYARANKVFDAESVDCGIMRWSVFVFHEVEDVATAADKENFHDEVVEGYPAV